MELPALWGAQTEEEASRQMKRVKKKKKIMSEGCIVTEEKKKKEAGNSETENPGEIKGEGFWVKLDSGVER